MPRLPELPLDGIINAASSFLSIQLMMLQSCFAHESRLRQIIISFEFDFQLKTDDHEL